MAEHPNAVIARRMIDAFNRGDMATFEGFVAEDVIWHEIGRIEPRRGKAELSAGGVSSSAVDYEIAAKVHDVVANDEHTVVLIDATATRAGKTFSYRVAEIYHIEDGKIAERWAFSDDTGAITAFFA